MKIGIYSNFFEPSIGGVETFVKLIAKEFSNKGHETLVITETKDVKKKIINKQNFKIFRGQNFIQKFLHLKNCDLIIMINFTLRNLLIFFLLRKKIIINHSNDYSYGNNLQAFLNYFKLYFSKFFINAPCSKYVKKKIKSNSKVIYNCYDNLIFKKIKSKKKGDFLFCGRLTTEKGLMILLNAFKKIQEKKINLKLGIVGDGPEKKNIVNFIKKNNFQNNIKLYGFKTGITLNKIINSYDCLVIPSVYEAFGIIALEGLASEKKIIASNVGGLPEALNKNGIIIDPNINSLYKAMKNIFLKKNINIFNSKKYKRNCKNHLMNFTPNKITNEYLKLYNNKLLN